MTEAGEKLQARNQPEWNVRLRNNTMNDGMRKKISVAFDVVAVVVVALVN